MKTIAVVPEETQQRLNMLEEKNRDIERELMRTKEEANTMVR